MRNILFRKTLIKIPVVTIITYHKHEVEKQVNLQSYFKNLITFGQVVNWTDSSFVYFVIKEKVYVVSKMFNLKVELSFDSFSVNQHMNICIKNQHFPINRTLQPTHKYLVV